MGGRALALGVVVGGLAFAGGAGLALAAPGFLPPETLAGTGTVAGTVHTAMAPNGFAIAGWEETLSGGQSAVRVATRPPGGPWSSAQQLELGTTPKSALFPLSVAIDAAGDAAIAWDDQATMTSDNALVSTRVAGQPFGAPQPLTGHSDPVVGIDASGNVTMIDVLPGGTATEVARTWHVGTPAPALPVTNLGNVCSRVFSGDLAVAPDGDAIAGIDCGSASTGGTTFVRRIAGVWQPAVILGPNSNNGTTQTSGNAVAVAIDGSGKPAGLFIEEVSSGAPPVTTSNYSLDLVTPTTTGMQLVTPAVDTATAFGFGGSEINFPDIATAGGSELLGWAVTGLGSTGDARAQTFNGSAPVGTPQTLGPSAGTVSVALSAGGPRLAVFEKASGTELDAAVAQAGGAFSVTPLSSANTLSSVAVDDAGDGVAAFAPPGTGATGARARGFDATPPALTSASIPGAALAGGSLAFSGAASDTWGPVTLSWNFGDGNVASGASVSHVFSTPGARTVSLTATDAVGNAVARTGQIVVAAIVPVLSRVSETHSAFKVGSSSTALNAAARRRRKLPTGTTFSFTLNEAARVSMTIAHSASGRVSHGRCV
jgi:hypothetical protein